MAQLRFPTPSGPAKIRAWGKRSSRSFLRSRSTTLALPINSSNCIRESEDLQDVLENSFNGPVRGDNVNSMWVAGCKGEIAVSDPCVERNILHLESSFVFGVLAVACPSARQADFRFDIEKDRDFRAAFATDEIRQLFDELNWNSATVALICH